MEFPVLTTLKSIVQSAHRLLDYACKAHHHYNKGKALEYPSLSQFTSKGYLPDQIICLE